MEQENDLIKADATAIAPLNREDIKSHIYTIRGIRVMMDSDIAVYFQTETGSLNRAMKRNQKRFPDTFCFQLTRDEIENLKCQFGISGFFDSYGGRRTMPYVYSEQGVAMLTSVLHTDRAISASIQIIEAFVEMSHFLQQNRQLLPGRNIQLLAERQAELESEVREIKDNMITRADLSDFMKLFDQGLSNEEILILDGEPFKADEAYQKIYRKARRKIIIVDDYIGVKTLHHLAHTKQNAKITIISDNAARPRLTQKEFNDFIIENPGCRITFLKSQHQSHDRYIVLDEGTKDMKVYHCGASSKDAGNRITTITRISDIDDYKATIREMLKNSPLILR